MIPPGNDPEWSRRVIVSYYLHDEADIMNLMGFMWFSLGIPAGDITIMPVRYMKHVNVMSLFSVSKKISPGRSEFERYQPISFSPDRTMSQRPNIAENIEKYSQTLVAAGLVPPGSLGPACPPSMPWDKAFNMERGLFWDKLPNDLIIAEIGVDQAGTATDLIIPKANPKKLYLVDPWDLINTPEEIIWPDAKETRERVQKDFEDNDKVEIVHNFSADAAKQFDDEYFDVVFSDWALAYEETKKDIADWLPKVKRGGIIGGDLLCLEDHHWSGAFGAIMEFLTKYVLEDSEILVREDAARTEFVKGLYNKYVENSIDIEGAEFYMKPHPYGDILVRHRSKTLRYASWGTDDEKSEDIFQLKPDLQTLVDLGRDRNFSYYPSGRTRAGTWSVTIGDWIDDVDFDELQEWANSNNENDWVPVVFEKK